MFSFEVPVEYRRRERKGGRESYSPKEMEQRSVEMQNSTDIFHMVLIMRVQRFGLLIVELPNYEGPSSLD